MASSSSSYLHAAVAFSKVPGTLSLRSNQVVRWVPSSATSGISSFEIKFSDIAGLQTSKAGAAQIALMLVLTNGVQVASKPKVLLVFNAAQDVALEDREKFKTELAAAVARNRANQEGAEGASTPASPTPFPSSPAPATRAATPDTRSGTPVPSKTASVSATGSPAPARKPTDNRPPSKTELELRISVIRTNPQLKALHKDIVISGQMSDAEFWSHPQRQRLIRAERAKLEQRAGRNARLADPKPTPNEAGEMKLSITPELIRDLFEQFPVVARAYEENVPSKVDEGAFWTRYFQSKLYHRLRTSARSAASEHIVQDDPIFDQYLEEEDNQLEPRRQYNPHDRLLDLQATEEDHAETGNQRDWTMRAGAERRTLPLMRRFNDHSQSLLDSALGDQEESERRKRRRIVGGVGEEYAESSTTASKSVAQGTSGNPPMSGGPQDADADENGDGDDEANDVVDWIKNHYYKDIVIDDLNEEEKHSSRQLKVTNLENYFHTELPPEESAAANGNSVEAGKRSVAGTTATQAARIDDDDERYRPKSMTEYVSVVEKFASKVETASIDLGTFQPTKSAASRTMSLMLKNIQSRSSSRVGKDGTTGVAGDLRSLPEPVQKSLLSLQATTTEFLRQFWNAIAPGPVGEEEFEEAAAAAATNGNTDTNTKQSGGGGQWNAKPPTLSSAERTLLKQQSKDLRMERTQKMVSNLQKFQAKLDQLIEDSFSTALTASNGAQEETLEKRINNLLEPTKKAVNLALAIGRRRGLVA